MFQIDLNKLFSKENLVVAIMVAILCVGLFLIYQTTNHLPSQIEKNRKTIEENARDLHEIKGMLKILIEEKK